MYFAFSADAFSWIFFGLISFMWVVVGIYATKYAEHLENRKRFYLFYILTYIMLVALCFSATYLTMYLSFEFMTLLSMPLVLHEGTPESIEAAKKYLFYSIFGATLGLLGMFFAGNYCTSLNFVPGGTLNMELASGHETAILIAVFLSVVGFGAKAGMFPLHSWLPTAHPVAPAPASAVLSGVITKAGVLCIIRVIYFVFGKSFLEGTWVQVAWLAMAMLTIFLGSLMAYQQDIFKKRLAYSTVSQVSYVLFGVFTMNKLALVGALLHIIYHSVIKNCLFMVAGATIFTNHKDKVSQLEGLGRKMPVTFACFTIASLGLVGVPPMAGFLSKWYLATGSLAEKIPVINWMGPAVLLASALLTAAYLLSISIHAFFPSDKEANADCVEAPKRMLLPMLILACLVVILGIFAQPWVNLFTEVVSVLF